ncbi:hypothetical protein IAD21_05072 [Abditibacteriota bacterium]|nr:hypothetical protein IAD21_05072 [Abditibacteriota bacterium]
MFHFVRPLPVLLLALSPIVARAQVLPSPANPAFIDDPDPTLDNPLPNDSPIIIGEPVRHQNNATPTPAKTPARPAPRVTVSGTVAGISVARQSDATALATLQRALAPQLQAPFRTVIGSYQYTFRRDELGAELSLRPLLARARRGENVPFQLSVNRPKLEAALRELDGQVRSDFGTVGINVTVSADRIEAALESSPPKPRDLLAVIPVRETTPTPEPETQATPSPQIGKGAFPFLLASFSTRYDASLRGRTVNLKMAANHINGTVVPAGAIFSTNGAIGPRNASNGWREAKMFVSGRVVSGTGAGICQAASTLYNCALLGNFPIVERHAHSMRVMYVPPSRDAALMWGSKDFKFRNTSGAPIRVETYVEGGKFHARVWGQKARSIPKVELVSMVTSRSGGTHSQAFKLVGGKKVKLSSDFYRPHP